MRPAVSSILHCKRVEKGSSALRNSQYNRRLKPSGVSLRSILATYRLCLGLGYREHYCSHIR